MSQEEPSRNLKGRKPEEELPPELKAIEAELSALRPRDDRLDRERLVFLAGQASVSGEAVGRSGRAAAWVWPASLAAMTAVAATLLVLLLLRPEPQVVERIRIVEVPVEASDGHSGRPTGNAGRDTESLPRPPRPAAESLPPTGVLASHRVSSFSRPGWERFGSRGEYLEMLDRMLARGIDPWRQPLTASDRGDEEADAAVPYRQWLKTMLNDQARAEQPSDWPSNSSDLGANS